MKIDTIHTSTGSSNITKLGDNHNRMTEAWERIQNLVAENISLKEELKKSKDLNFRMANKINELQTENNQLMHESDESI